MDRAALKALARQWRRHRALRDVGRVVAAACVAAGIVIPFHPSLAAALGLVIAVATGIGLRRRASPITAATIAEHLNRRCPALEESAALWLPDSRDLGLVERLQLQRLERAWNQLPHPRPGAPQPRQLFPALIAATVSAAFLVAIGITTTPPGAQPAKLASPPRPPTPESSLVLASAMEIHPPAYLGRPVRRVDTLSAEIEEGAEVLWSFAVAPNVTGLELSSRGTNDALVAEPLGEGRFQIRHGLIDTFLYQVSVRPRDGPKITLPALHVVQVRRDEPPRLTWRSPAAARTPIPPATHLPPAAIEVLAGDDHGVAEVRLLLTVARGSGEGVRFQERPEVLQKRSSEASSNHVYGTSLDLVTLALEPGDELYLQAVALDTRRPSPNEARTETRRLVFTGPSTRTTDGNPPVALSGVRRIHQYFRSQRQLILDTETLLEERSALPETQFRARSENLGIDQKLLRLRYGQFLGEEFEPTSAGAPREAAAMEWAAALRNPSTQDADRTAAIGRAIEAAHAHEPGPTAHPTPRPWTAPNIFADLAHNHDSPEAATFFDENLQSSLRAVLAAMWEAEGFLRTAQPAAALPSERRALEILKAIQQADRLSVGRVGSELPPLPLDARRLHGDLEAIPTFAPGTSTPPHNDSDAAALRLAVACMAGNEPQRIPEEVAARVEDRLWRAAEAQPGRYLPALEQWRARGTPLPPSAIEGLRQAVWSLLPATEESPHRRRQNRPGLEQRYADALSDASYGQP